MTAHLRWVRRRRVGAGRDLVDDEVPCAVSSSPGRLDGPVTDDQALVVDGLPARSASVAAVTNGRRGEVLGCEVSTVARKSDGPCASTKTPAWMFLTLSSMVMFLFAGKVWPWTGTAHRTVGAFSTCGVSATPLTPTHRHDDAHRDRAAAGQHSLGSGDALARGDALLQTVHERHLLSRAEAAMSARFATASRT